MNKKVRSFILAAAVVVLSAVSFTGCSLFTEEDTVNFYITNNAGSDVTIDFSTDLDIGKADPILVPAGASNKIYTVVFRSHSTVANIISGYGIILTNNAVSKSVRYNFECSNNGPAVYITINSDGTLSKN